MKLFKVKFHTNFRFGNVKDVVVFLIVAPDQYTAKIVADHAIADDGHSDMIPPSATTTVTLLGTGLTVNAQRAHVIDTNVRSY